MPQKNYVKLYDAVFIGYYYRCMSTTMSNTLSPSLPSEVPTEAYTEKPLSPDYLTTLTTEYSSNESVSHYGWIIAVVIAILLVLVIVIIVLVIRKCKQSSSNKGHL